LKVTYRYFCKDTVNKKEKKTVNKSEEFECTAFVTGRRYVVGTLNTSVIISLQLEAWSNTRVTSLTNEVLEQRIEH
jgi:hypothetical protein